MGQKEGKLGMSTMERCPWCDSVISRSKFLEIETSIRDQEKKRLAEVEAAMRKRLDGEFRENLENQRAAIQKSAAEELAAKTAAITAEGGVQSIVATHWHLDHWATYDAVRAATGAPVLVGDAEINIPEERIDGRLRDGAEVRVGGVRIEVLHTPGHTPGSISLRVGQAVITGDTLFNGGPGRTFDFGDLETILASIDARLLPLPPGTVVLPGHGVNTSIAEARTGRDIYRRHPRAPGFFGDVEWRR